jgi:hypothetical protein
MKEVDQAIVTQFASNSSLNTRYGAILYHMDGARLTLPSALFFKVSSIPSEAIAGRFNEQMRYQFTLYDTDKAQLDDSIAALWTTFDRCKPSLSGSLVWTSCQRLDTRYRQVADRPGTNDRVYKALIDYRIRVDRSF